MLRLTPLVAVIGNSLLSSDTYLFCLMPQSMRLFFIFNKTPQFFLVIEAANLAVDGDKTLNNVKFSEEGPDWNIKRGGGSLNGVELRIAGECP